MGETSVPGAKAMRPRDYVVEAFEFREPAVLPYQWYMDQAVRDAVDARMGGTRWRDRLISFFYEDCFPLPNREIGDSGQYIDAYGSRWARGSIMHLLRPALAEPDLRGFVWPDVDALWAGHADALRARLAAHPDRYRVAGLSFGLFERGWTLRGFAEILMDMASDPAFAEALFDAIMEHQMRIVDKLLMLDIDAVWFSDDWGQQTGLIMGPALWRRYIKPRKAAMIAQVHRAGKKAVMHCCGSVMEIMPEIVEIGLDGLQSLQPEAMDPFELKRRFGRDIVLWGGGPSQSLIPFGAPDEIRAAFRRLRSEMGVGGGYICGPAKPMLAETPVENAIATMEGVVGHPLERGR